MPVRPGRPKYVVRVCAEFLVEEPLRQIFNSHLRQSFNHIQREAGDIESEWAMFCTSLLKQLTRAVAIRSLVPALAAILESDDGHLG